MTPTLSCRFSPNYRPRYDAPLRDALISRPERKVDYPCRYTYYVTNRKRQMRGAHSEPETLLGETVETVGESRGDGETGPRASIAGPPAQTSEGSSHAIRPGVHIVSSFVRSSMNSAAYIAEYGSCGHPASSVERLGTPDWPDYDGRARSSAVSPAVRERGLGPVCPAVPLRLSLGRARVAPPGGSRR